MAGVTGQQALFCLSPCARRRARLTFSLPSAFSKQTLYALRQASYIMRPASARASGQLQLLHHANMPYMLMHSVPPSYTPLNALPLLIHRHCRPTCLLPPKLPRPSLPLPAQFLMDHIHPNQLGKFLYADMLIHAVKDAQRALKRAADSGEQLPPLRLPARPMTDKGNLVVSKSCYMALQPNMTHMMEVEEVPHEYIPIVKNKGWEFVMHDGNPGATWKPGGGGQGLGGVL